MGRLKTIKLYHETKYSLYVKEFLRHKRLDRTLRYINICRALYYSGDSDEFHIKVAEKPEEFQSLLEVDFQYFCEKNGLLFFKKRK